MTSFLVTFGLWSVEFGCTIPNLGVQMGWKWCSAGDFFMERGRYKYYLRDFDTHLFAERGLRIFTKEIQIKNLKTFLASIEVW